MQHLVSSVFSKIYWGSMFIVIFSKFIFQSEASIHGVFTPTFSHKWMTWFGVGQTERFIKSSYKRKTVTKIVIFCGKKKKPLKKSVPKKMWKHSQTTTYGFVSITYMKVESEYVPERCVAYASPIHPPSAPITWAAGELWCTCTLTSRVITYHPFY